MRNSARDEGQRGFYIPTRYPNGLPGGIPAEAYPQETAQDAVRLAAQVVDVVARELDELGPPDEETLPR